MANEQVQIEILTEIKKSQKSLTDLVGSFAKLYGAYKLIEGVGGAMLKEWQEQERACSKLGNALRLTGIATGATQRNLEDMADKLQYVTTYSDDATISSMAMLQQLGNLSEQGLMKITPLVQDFAAAMGIDLEQAASLVGKTLGSNTNALGRYGVQVDGSADKSTKLAQITEQLQTKFGGMAEAMGKTSSGSMKIMENAFNELLTVGGKYLSNVLDPMIRGSTELMKTLSGRVNDLENFQSAMDGKKTANYAAALQLVNKELEKERDMLKASQGVQGEGLADTAILEKRIELMRDQKNELAENARRSGQLAVAEKAIVDANKAIAESGAKANETYLTAYELLQMQEDATAGLTAAQAAGSAPAKQFAANLSEQVDAASMASKEWAKYAEWLRVVRGETENLQGATKTSLETFKESYSSFAQNAGAMFGGVEKISNQYFKNQDIGIENEYKTRRDAINATITNEEEKAAAMAALEEDIDKKRRESARQQAEQAKLFALFEIAIATASAIVKSLPNIPLAIAMGALGGAQAALVAAQPMPMAQGGEFTTNGPQLLMVGDNAGGREHVQVTPLGSGGGTPQVVINNLSGTAVSATAREEQRPGGEKRLIITLTELIKATLASGKADGTMAARYGLAPVGRKVS